MPSVSSVPKLRDPFHRRAKRLVTCKDADIHRVLPEFSRRLLILRTSTPVSREVCIVVCMLCIRFYAGVDPTAFPSCFAKEIMPRRLLTPWRAASFTRLPRTAYQPKAVPESRVTTCMSVLQRGPQEHVVKSCCSEVFSSELSNVEQSRLSFSILPRPSLVSASRPLAKMVNPHVVTLGVIVGAGGAVCCGYAITRFFLRSAPQGHVDGANGEFSQAAYMRDVRLRNQDAIAAVIGLGRQDMVRMLTSRGVWIDTDIESREKLARGSSLDTRDDVTEAGDVSSIATWLLMVLIDARLPDVTLLYDTMDTMDTMDTTSHRIVHD